MRGEDTAAQAIKVDPTSLASLGKTACSLLAGATTPHKEVPGQDMCPLLRHEAWTLEVYRTRIGLVMGTRQTACGNKILERRRIFNSTLDSTSWASS